VIATRLRLFGFGLLALVAGCGASEDPFSDVGSGGTSGASSSGASGGGAGSGGSASGAGGSAGAGATAGSGTAAGNGGAAGTSGGAGNTAGTGGEMTAGSAGSAGESSGGAGGSGSAGDAGTSGTEGGIPTDPPPGEYGDRAALPELNSEMAVAEASGKIYVLGGYPSSREYQATVQVYDPASDTWDLAAPLPVPIHHPVAAGVGGKLYSLGGQTDDGDSARTLVYDPATNGPWTDLAEMPTARGAGAAAVIDDKIYVVGGRPPAGNAFEVYDVSDDEWTELPPLPDAFPERNHLAAAAIGGKVYVAGGRYDGGSFSDPMTDSLDIFDPTTGEWSLGAPMLRERGGVNGVMAYGCFHVWGGEGADTGEPNDVFPDHDVYNPLTDEWTALPNLPTPIHGVTGAVFLAGLIYMPGGGTMQGGSSGSDLFQVYHPVTRCE
jgi:N-acetylneuraminic acid mutarotase